MNNTPANTGQNHKGRWRKGQSGNPMGKPQGSRHKATLAAEALLDGEAEALTRKAVEMALAGDATAMRLCLERILPPRKERPVALNMPPIKTARDLIPVTSALVEAVGSGELTPGEGADLSRLIANIAQAIEVTDLEERIEQIETSLETKGK